MMFGLNGACCARFLNQSQSTARHKAINKHSVVCHIKSELTSRVKERFSVKHCYVTILGRSPSPMKGVRGTSHSLDWDHSVDTNSPQGNHLPCFLEYKTKVVTNRRKQPNQEELT